MPLSPAEYDVFNRARSGGIIVVAATGNNASDNDVSPGPGKLEVQQQGLLRKAGFFEVGTKKLYFDSLQK